jgi:hypothetical protein
MAPASTDSNKAPHKADQIPVGEAAESPALPKPPRSPSSIACCSAHSPRAICWKTRTSTSSGAWPRRWPTARCRSRGTEGQRRRLLGHRHAGHDLGPQPVLCRPEGARHQRQARLRSSACQRGGDAVRRDRRQLPLRAPGRRLPRRRGAARRAVDHLGRVAGRVDRHHEEQPAVEDEPEAADGLPAGQELGAVLLPRRAAWHLLD